MGWILLKKLDVAFQCSQDELSDHVVVFYQQQI